MATGTQFRSRLLGSAATALVVALAPLAAHAQSAASIDQIERQIRQLQGELQSLKRDLRRSQAEAQRARAQAAQATAAAAEAQQQAAQARSAAPPPVAAVPPPPAGPPAPHAVQTAGNRFGLESADGRNSIYLTGRLHLDLGDYLDYNPASKFASVQDLNSGVNARRARLGVTGKFAGDWAYTFIYDLGGSADGFPPDTGGAASGIQTGLLTYNGLNHGPMPLAFDIGYQDTPFTLDEATSSNDIMFVERASIQTVSSNIMANDFRSSLGVRSNNDRYWVGVYMTGPQSGAAHNTGEQVGAFGRATYQVIQNPEGSLHLGADVGGLLKPPTVGGVRCITLSDRPELRVDPTAIITTGGCPGGLGTAANPLNDAAVYGLELAAGWHNFYLQSEYYHIMVDRSGLPTNGFDGGYVEGSWTLTGEHRKYLPATGAYSAIVPNRPFSPWSGDYGTGAFELAARYSEISLNDAFNPGVPLAKGSNAVGGGHQTTYEFGLNWYPNTNVRFMFDYLHGDISKKFSTAAGGGIAGTPLGTPIGGNFDALVMRTQFAF